MTRTKPPTLAKLRQSLKRKGWSLRTAAPVMGVSFGHLHRVLSGERHSSRILAEVAELPARKEQAQ